MARAVITFVACVERKRGKAGHLDVPKCEYMRPASSNGNFTIVVCNTVRSKLWLVSMTIVGVVCFVLSFVGVVVFVVSRVLYRH